MKVGGGAGSTSSGGNVCMMSGHGTATSSGEDSLTTPNAGMAGVSGAIDFFSGTTSTGNSGDMAFSTGSSVEGKGGDICALVGSSSTHDGGDVSLESGTTLAADMSGGSLFICSGNSTNTLGGPGGDINVESGASAGANGGNVFVGVGDGDREFDGGMIDMEAGKTLAPLKTGGSVSISGGVGAN